MDCVRYDCRNIQRYAWQRRIVFALINNTFKKEGTIWEK